MDEAEDLAESWRRFELFCDEVAGQDRLAEPLPTCARDCEPCPVCGGFDRVLDELHCERVCVGCGNVLDYDRFVEMAESHHRHRESAGYQRVYHLHEVLAAWLLNGPVVPDDEFARMAVYVAATPVFHVTDDGYRVDRGPLSAFNRVRLQPLQMNRKHIRQMCAELGLREFSERWCVSGARVARGPARAGLTARSSQSTSRRATPPPHSARTSSRAAGCKSKCVSAARP